MGNIQHTLKYNQMINGIKEKKREWILKHHSKIHGDNGLILKKRSTTNGHIPKSKILKPNFETNGIVETSKKSTLHTSYNNIGTKKEIDHKSFDYSLSAVVVHLGNANGGHYVCYRRVLSDTNVNNEEDYKEFLKKKINQNLKWVHLSDSQWEMVNESKVRSQLAYMLFYESGSN